MLSELPVLITPEALKQVKYIMAKKDIPNGYGLRIGTQNAASCGATSFILGFDEKKTGDDSFEHEGIDILINKKEMIKVIGITLDYEIGKKTSGFKFEQ